MSEWIRSSEQTPPKDGKPFLCYDPSQKNNFKHATIYVVRWISGTQFSDEGYIESGGECYFRWEPLFWMPLPTPPALPEPPNEQTPEVSQDMKDAGFTYREVDPNHPKMKAFREWLEKQE